MTKHRTERTDALSTLLSAKRERERVYWPNEQTN